MRIPITDSIGDVGAILDHPADARWLLVFAHGAGAGMDHRWMSAMAEALGQAGIATLRFNFPYMDRKRGVPDSKPVLYKTFRKVVEHAHTYGLPLLAGGKSMGGRMASNAQAVEPLSGVNGLVFFGFPLHPSGKPGIERAEHLARVQIPMLFLQGTRDALADLDLLEPVCNQLEPRSTLHVVDTADHSFHVQKASGKSDKDVIVELAETVGKWAESLSLDLQPPT